MDKLSKHGTVAEKKTKSSVKQISAWVFSILLLISVVGCDYQGSYVTAAQLTSTAAVAPVGIGGGDQENVPTVSTPESQPSPAPILSTDAPVSITSPATPVSLTSTASPRPSPTPTLPGTPLPPILYNTLPGDTLPAVAIRFGVPIEEIIAPNGPVPPQGLIQPETLLLIPNRLIETGPEDRLIPDSEVVYSPSTLDFDLEGYVKSAGGRLSTYQEYLGNGWNEGWEVVQRVAVENSINPRLLLALLEYQSHWVFGQPTNLQEDEYPLGFVHLDRKGLFKQLNWAMQKVSLGYYGWRDGSITSVTFPDATTVRMNPRLNAGTAAIQYYFAIFNDQQSWYGVLGGEESFAALYERMFDNPWLRAQAVEPLLPMNLTQPELQLPYLPGRVWSYSGGPHAAWAKDGARAALDFAPSSLMPGCVKSTDWVTAVAPGLVVRSRDGVVVVDLDGDGFEQTGWVILYLHIASESRIPAGSVVDQDGRIGHPSCEGGSSTGTHVHIARKYNGEWVLADGPLPFVLSGWTAHAGPLPYQGTMTKDDQVATANTYGSAETLVRRPID